MTILNNLSSLILRDLIDSRSAQDFGNIFQSLVETAIRLERPALAAQGNAGNPDFIWMDPATNHTWGYEVKSSSNPSGVPVSIASRNALGQQKHKRLVYLDTSGHPVRLYVCDLETFLAATVNQGGNGNIHPRNLQNQTPPGEENELVSGLERVIQTMNTALFDNLPEQQIPTEIKNRLSKVF